MARANEYNHRITVELESYMYLWLENHCKKNNLARARVIREALAEYIESEEEIEK